LLLFDSLGPAFVTKAVAIFFADAGSGGIEDGFSFFID
jgi:hypothetical protein